MSVSGRSYRASRRVHSWYPAKQTAERSVSTAAGWKTSVPGRMMTSAPQNPTMTAAPRHGPTRSFSSGADSATTTSGVVNMRAEAVASWMWGSAAMNTQLEAKKTKERPIISRGR